MKITVIGSGRWGSFITWYLHKIGHILTVYGRAQSTSFKQILQTRQSGMIHFDENIQLTTDLPQAMSSCDVLIISVSSQNLRELLYSIYPYVPQHKIIVLCMKGIEMNSGKRLSEVVLDVIPGARIAVWVGPGHVQDFLSGQPNCMVIDSLDSTVTEFLIDSFSGNLIRFYYGTDLIGSEVGAASKNVIGIAAGVLDGLNKSSLKGALMSRGTREIARLIKAMGGNEMSAYGLCHLGDYEATVFSQYSHNRQYGEYLVSGKSYDFLAEGVYTVKALCLLSEKYKVDLPICNSVYQVIYNKADINQTMTQLFLRKQRDEFYL